MLKYKIPVPHHEIWKYCQSTSQAHANVLQNLIVHLITSMPAGNGPPGQEAWAGGRSVTTSRRPSKPLRRVNPDPSSDGGEGEDVSGSSDDDPNAPESGRKRSRSGRGTPKRKRRHRLAVVKGGWNEEDDAKLTR